MNPVDSDPKEQPSRRDFIRAYGAAATGAALALHIPTIPGAYAAGNDTIRVGLIGCGGRGTGAAQNAMDAAPGVKLVAMGDVFKDQLDSSRATLMRRYADKMDVPAERSFVGFDAYKKVLASDINYVIMAAPPGFRPEHLQAAVTAGKHIFTEKPVAVDGPGIRLCLELYEQAKAKGLAIVAGTQRRHQKGYVETMKRIHDGAIGRIAAARAYWNQGGLWRKDRQGGWSDLEWQVRNWLYFTWLSGDLIVEQHIHNIDVVNWAMRAHPIRAVGMGGRQARTDPVYGHVYDHFTVDYEFENGVHEMSMCRQISGTDRNVSEALVGTEGACRVDKYTITGGQSWKFAGPDNQPYRQEHADLIESIRAGNPINELQTVTETTLTAIMGRMSAYTGKVVTWEEALNSKESLRPAKLEWGPLTVPPVPIPGQPTVMAAGKT
ncbi:MAG: Gfo/Idh/MocA family oxidoreductase [Acidobacteria bacterium]|nr:Gfo/Idh/MocA family oxidoreductase [Acidobacteriota bacterium]MBI3656638.1 Gfo/Idh/MocA family oxidoreductase [Acidobacteriota bacterium]